MMLMNPCPSLRPMLDLAFKEAGLVLVNSCQSLRAMLDLALGKHVGPCAMVYLTFREARSTLTNSRPSLRLTLSISSTTPAFKSAICCLYPS